MNKVIIAAALGLAAAASVSAQGTLSLNTATGAKPRVTVGPTAADQHNALAADNIWVQVVVGNIGGSISGDPFQLTLGGANAGLFSKGTFTVAGLAGGATANVTVNAWDKSSGDTYANAKYRASQSFSVTLGGKPDDNGIPSLPAGLVGTGLFSGLAVVTPEPSTYALAALGLGGLLFLRRK